MATPAPAIRAAAWATVWGSLGVVAVSACYATSPEPTVLPVLPVDLEAAIAGATSGAPTIPLIAAIGMPADVLTAAGAALLAYGRFFERGRGSEALGWLLIAFASLFFLGTDTIAGAVLTPLANAGDRSAFLAMKTLLDFFFVGGTVAVGAGAILAGLPNLSTKNDMPRSLSLLLALAGVAGLVARRNASRHQCAEAARHQRRGRGRTLRARQPQDRARARCLTHRRKP